LFYLKDIEEKSNSIPNIQARCVYFYYKLMDLVKKCKGNCNNTECYRILKKPRPRSNPIHIPNICQNVVHEIQFIETNFYDALYYMDELYRTIHILSADNNSCQRYSEEYNKYVQILKSCDFRNNLSFQKLIENAEKHYNKACHKSVVTEISQKVPSKPLIKDTNQETSKTPMNDILANAVRETSTRAMTETLTGTETGVIVFSFIMLTIVFVLYKYTPYASFLPLGIKELRATLKKNKKKYHNDLIDSFEKTYKNSIDKKYQIAYSSEY
ncbi:variable surface protein, partial [Plasmodium gonderi]